MAYAIDLFCGAGGCSEGLIQAGFHILFSSDISDMAEKTYRNRHEQLGLQQGKNTWFERRDIRELTGEEIKNYISKLEIFKDKKIPDIDLMIGGPSCQGFSRAGRRDNSDPRNMLFGEYIRVINEIKPKYIVLENVEGFMDMQFYGYSGINGNIYPDGSVAPVIMKQELHQIGYKTLDVKVLNAADYGVPQKRRRVIFIGYREDVTKPSYPIPTVSPEKYITLEDAIGDLVTKSGKMDTSKTRYQIESINGRTPTIEGTPIACTKIKNTELSRQTEIVRERFELFEEGETGTNLKKRILSEGIDISDKPNLVSFCANKLNLNSIEVIELFKNKLATKEQVDILLTKKNIRQKWSRKEPANTVLTIADDFISPWEPRSFSVREMARCQSFDDSFEFLGKRTTGGLRRRVEVPQYTQVGNAVPPLMAKAIAEEILKVL
ncbi:DNA cytosine methyltransferase [Veillonella atypica]|uniref:DNA cytosine methyltransferase n=1 Tax=Veillonella atypica TaxID=39777 RepID=UPI0019604509|nr:DNA cytosine methyltransferase [Veillonella atypica]VTY43053.1 Modification methylase BspRI [Veillonella atypica]